MYIHNGLTRFEVSSDKEKVKLCQVCLKIPYRGIVISIVLDDSYGADEHLVRSELRIFEEEPSDRDITKMLLISDEDKCKVDGYTLQRIMKRIDDAIEIGLLPRR